MQVSNVAAVEASAKLIVVGTKLHPLLLNHVAGPTDGGGTVVPVLHHVVSRASHHKAGSGGDIECIFSIATRAHDIQRSVVGEIYRNPHIEQCIAETEDLVHRDAAHQKGGNQRCHLRIGDISLHNGEEHLFGFLPREIMIIE